MIKLDSPEQVQEATTQKPGKFKATPLLYCMCMAVTATGPILLYLYQNQETSPIIAPTQITTPDNALTFHLSEATDYSPNFHSANLLAYYKLNIDAGLHIAYYQRQTNKRKLIYSGNSLLPSNWKPTTTLHALSENQKVITNGIQFRLITYWYNVDGQLTNSPFKAKLLQLTALTKGQTDAALIVMDIRCITDRCDQALFQTDQLVTSIQGLAQKTTQLIQHKP